ncbi:glycoside hydrolase family 16 protein [Pengzhenrongella sicca]|uniref:Glycoside hydrolase family 16 protein n=1 Tax=Pengzhenrongella sicca TaxID=2819238 RepID=A0A8A4Z7G7_9MICO|nr:glycoside hydrolase family 16 protein [Pengzhenrongella sicca]QTE27782.1 glycoside hydrolase family 16 protein [Pengzhenrongella sicca]
MRPVGAPGAPSRLDLERYELEFDENFGGTELNRDHWLPYYLPQWSSRAATEARYDIRAGCLTLRVDADQAPWSPEFDGEVRVSSLQTGLWSGPLGSPNGQHRFRPGLVVREPQAASRLYTPRFGVVEVRAAATDDPDALVALWMIGVEDAPERSAEICVVEVFGADVGPGVAAVGMGIHPFADPTLVDDFSVLAQPIDARELHRYAVRWTPDEVAFYLDRELVRVIGQAPQYPMQLMLNVYDLTGPGHEGRYPKEFVVDYVHGYRPR